MNSISAHRPAVEWLSDLQRAKVEGSTGSKPKSSIQDLLERASDPTSPESQLIPTSPRSVEACFRLGIDPVEIQFRPASLYRRNGEDDSIAQMRYERSEQFRQDRIRSLIEERKALIDEGWTGEPEGGRGGGGGGRKGEASSGMVEKERQRLEVLKRRQERDLQQMLQYEVTRKGLLEKQQRKVEQMDRRAAELQRHKAGNDAAWAKRQQELELTKMREEQALEREGKRIAEERFQRERELQQREAEEDKRRKKEAFLRELERRQKTEDARRDTDAILAQQAEEVRLRKVRMEAQDAERARRLDAEAKETARRNGEKRQQAQLRISSAISANRHLMQQKREEFNRRESANESRRQQLADTAAKDELRKQEGERRKELERQDKYHGALTQEELRKTHIRDRAKDKECALAELYAQRKKDNDIRRVEREFELKTRLDKVDSIQKTNLYHRAQLLDKIMEEYERTRAMIQERSAVQEQRKMANMTASLHRHMIAQAMDQLKCTKSLDKLTGGSGTVNINDLLSRRPMTAM
ncbi:MAG: hypothetical protein WDW36_006280 [Sanguina aurantia]